MHAEAAGSGWHDRSGHVHGARDGDGAHGAAGAAAAATAAIVAPHDVPQAHDELHGGRDGGGGARDGEHEGGASRIGLGDGTDADGSDGADRVARQPFDSEMLVGDLPRSDLDGGRANAEEFDPHTEDAQSDSADGMDASAPSRRTRRTDAALMLTPTARAALRTRVTDLRVRFATRARGDG